VATLRRLPTHTYALPRDRPCIEWAPVVTESGAHVKSIKMQNDAVGSASALVTFMCVSFVLLFKVLFKVCKRSCDVYLCSLQCTLRSQISR
jgi:hypothetical protein